MAVPRQAKPKSTLAILCQSLILSSKNIHLSLPVFVVSTLIAFLVYIANTLVSTPVLTDLLFKAISIASLDPSSPKYSALLSAIRGDARELALFTALVHLVIFLVSYLSAVAYVHIITISCFDKPSAIVKDFLPKLKESPQGPLITLLMVAVLSWGYALLLLLAPAAFFVLVAPGSIIFVAAGVVVLAFLIVLFLYFSVLWSVAVVVSVVEPELYGVAAISKAAEITKGRMTQGVVIVLAMLVVTGVIAVAYSAFVLYVAPQTTAWRLGITFVYLAIATVVHLFVEAGFTVFYYDCLESRRYHSLPTAHLGDPMV